MTSWQKDLVNMLRKTDMDDGGIVRKNRVVLSWRASARKDMFSCNYAVEHGSVGSQYIEREMGVACEEWCVTAAAAEFHRWNMQ